MNKLKAFIRNLFVSNKKKELHAVVDSYTPIVQYAANTMVGAYRAAAHEIIDCTFEQPEVALNLINAAKAATELYAPVFEKMGRGVDYSFNTETVKELLTIFETALKQLDD